MGAWYIGVLVLLEGLLSADNALVLAVMVRHLPRDLQRRVLFWGIWGAVGFRFVALTLSAILLKFWLCKVIGGGYLLYLALSHFWTQYRDHSSSSQAAGQTQRPESRPLLHGFWGTVTSITMADIAFSIDSILTAVAMSEGFPARFGPNGKLFIVFVGGVLGIITMRFVVRYFLILLDRFPGLAEGAYYLVAWIGYKLYISGLHTAGYLHYHIPEWLFWVVMLLIAAISILVRPGKKSTDEDNLSSKLDLFDSDLSDEDQSDDSDDETEGGSGRDGSDQRDESRDPTCAPHHPDTPVGEA
jgi:YkoY family integral membrane protein